MIIHAEVVSRERIFIICLFKLFGRSLRQRAAYPREIALLSLPFRINRISRPDYWKLGSCPLYTLLRYTEGLTTFSHRRNVFTILANICIKIRRIDLTLSIYPLNYTVVFIKFISLSLSLTLGAVCRYILYMHFKHLQIDFQNIFHRV